MLSPDYEAQVCTGISTKILEWPASKFEKILKIMDVNYSRIFSINKKRVSNHLHKS